MQLQTDVLQIFCVFHYSAGQALGLLFRVNDRPMDPMRARPDIHRDRDVHRRGRESARRGWAWRSTALRGADASCVGWRVGVWQMSKVRPPYPAEFRQQMVELVRAGRSPAQLSREFGVTAQSITNWGDQAAIDDGKPLPGKEGLTSADPVPGFRTVR